MLGIRIAHLTSFMETTLFLCTVLSQFFLLSFLCLFQNCEALSPVEYFRGLFRLLFIYCSLPPSKQVFDISCLWFFFFAGCFCFLLHFAILLPHKFLVPLKHVQLIAFHITKFTCPSTRETVDYVIFLFLQPFVDFLKNRSILPKMLKTDNNNLSKKSIII
ncbi:hypothetical protein BC829DRAFT_92470 [Chytridium lagenaria]|nr:hypothetical protein BC829DRAFT_92470 [Chytridium lagenaria]